jgi:AcrR family transcriptional regulator
MTSPDGPAVAAGRWVRTGRTGRRTGSPPTREAILETAAEMFHRDGYSGTSLRAVARAAEVDAALVVHYFGTKAGLLRAALQAEFEHKDDPMAEVLASGPGEVAPAVAQRERHRATAHCIEVAASGRVLDPNTFAADHDWIVSVELGVKHAGDLVKRSQWRSL